MKASIPALPRGTAGQGPGGGGAVRPGSCSHRSHSLGGGRCAYREQNGALPRGGGPHTSRCEGGEAGPNVTLTVRSHSRAEIRSQGCTAPRHLGLTWETKAEEK